jgi:hypothetical protein
MLYFLFKNFCRRGSKERTVNRNKKEYDDDDEDGRIHSRERVIYFRLKKKYFVLLSYLTIFTFTHIIKDSHNKFSTLLLLKMKNIKNKEQEKEAKRGR